MAIDNIHKDKKRLITGVTKATDMIRGTYGAAGGNVVLEEHLYPFHSVRNDGKAIVEKIKLADQVENIGADIIKEAGDKADKDSGDGRKTTMILTEAIFYEAQKFKAQPLEIKRSLDACVPILIKAIDDQKKDIDVSQIKSVATISSESEHIGSLMQEIYEKIGKDGIVEIDNSGLPETFYEVTEGVKLRNAGFFGAYSTTETGKAVYKNPKILISKDKIVTTDQLEPIMVALSQAGISELVIYCDDIDMSVASKLALTHLQGGFKTLLIRSPKLWKDWLFEDFAKITGATLVDSMQGKTFKSLSLGDLGTCAQLISTKDETRVIGIKDISEHIEALRKEGSDNAKIRISWLQTKVAVLKVGAGSESELSYVSKKAKDACNASYLALKDGVVAGGGIALYNASKALPDTIGGKILKEALKAPLATIIWNSGYTISKKAKNPKGTLFLGKDFGGTRGFDAKEGKLVDMFEAGIIDPAIVIKNALKNSVSIASTVMTLCGIITLPKLEPHENHRQMPGM